MPELSAHSQTAVPFLPIVGEEGLSFIRTPDGELVCQQLYPMIWMSDNYYFDSVCGIVDCD